MLLWLMLILATSPWCLSELWGGGVPTLDIDHSRPRLRRLLFRTLIWPVLPYPPDILCTAYPAVFFHPASTQDHPPTRTSPLFVPAYQKIHVNLPSLIRHHHIPTLPLLPRPHHAFQIPVTAAPTLLSKSLLEWSLAVVMQTSVTTRDRLFLSLLTPTTPARLPSPPLPRCCRNIF